MYWLCAIFVIYLSWVIRNESEIGTDCRSLNYILDLDFDAWGHMHENISWASGLCFHLLSYFIHFSVKLHYAK